jgi:manganese/iron transport system permease protein
MGVAVAVAILSTILGLYLSFYADLPSGPSIVMVATGIFLLALLLSPSRGLLWRWRPSAVTMGDGR